MFHVLLQVKCRMSKLKKIFNAYGNIKHFILSLLAYIGMGVYAVLEMRKKSIVSYGILFFLITLFSYAYLTTDLILRLLDQDNGLRVGMTDR